MEVDLVSELGPMADGVHDLGLADLWKVILAKPQIQSDASGMADVHR
jgi:hypothetical protein